MSDIKETVEELERLERDIGRTTSHVDACFAQRDWNETALQAVPSLLAELRRLWGIEEAAVRYREIADKGELASLDAYWDARDVFFAALPPRKEDA